MVSSTTTSVDTVLFTRLLGWAHGWVVGAGTGLLGSGAWEEDTKYLYIPHAAII